MWGCKSADRAKLERTFNEASAGLRQFLTIGSGILLGLGKTVLPCHGMCRTPIETVASLFAKSIFLRTFASTPRQWAGNT